MNKLISKGKEKENKQQELVRTCHVPQRSPSLDSDIRTGFPLTIILLPQIPPGDLSASPPPNLDLSVVFLSFYSPQLFIFYFASTSLPVLSSLSSSVLFYLL